jgi:hypothetical protein
VFRVRPPLPTPRRVHLQVSASLLKRSARGLWSLLKDFGTGLVKRPEDTVPIVGLLVEVIGLAGTLVRGGVCVWRCGLYVAGCVWWGVRVCGGVACMWRGVWRGVRVWRCGLHLAGCVAGSACVAVWLAFGWVCVWWGMRVCMCVCTHMRWVLCAPVRTYAHSAPRRRLS